MFSTARQSLPAACADCIETTRFAQAGLAPIQNAMQQFRSAEGKIRIDFGTMSIISNPLTQARMILDHPAMEARILAAPQLPPLPNMAGAQLPHLPALPPGLLQIAAAAAMATRMEQLGKALIEGHEVQGMRYAFGAGAALTSWEVWTSTKLALPVLTKTIGPFGERVCVCKCAAVQTPAVMFEPPSGYKIIHS
ncbi:MAG TPA: hypothetical protein VKX39_08530 [Bryobacteraceae bacterium]|nr:hypothetical protein [Bryobacteraceae bacterium]